MTTPTPTRWREANRGTAIKETPRGVLYLEFNERRVTALRPDPATAWVKHRDLPAWRGTAMPDISLGDLIRQIHAARLIRGGVLRKDIPEDERPPARPYETRRRESFARFLEHVPTDVEVELTHRYPGRDWQLYRWATAFLRRAQASMLTNANGHVDADERERARDAPPRGVAVLI